MSCWPWILMDNKLDFWFIKLYFDHKSLFWDLGSFECNLLHLFHYHGNHQGNGGDQVMAINGYYT